MQQIETMTISNELLRENYRTLQSELTRLNEVSTQMKTRFADEKQSLESTLASAAEDKR